MTTYALDSNIVSYFLKNDDTIRNRINEETDKGNDFVIPPTVYFEIMNWLLKNASKKMAIFERMYSEKSRNISVIFYRKVKSNRRFAVKEVKEESIIGLARF
jgi:predicted nucleic acid-binding protein